jgi:hypothetical protein
METKKIEVIVAKKGTKAGAGGAIAKTFASPQKEHEAGGRAWIACSSFVQCPHCGAIGWIVDKEHITSYTCYVCGEVIVL